MASLSSRSGKNKVLVERSVYLLGRFLTKDVNHVSMERLRTIIRYDKGQKTKLRFGTTGLSSGHKYTSAIMKNKIPHEFTPIADIFNVTQDPTCANVLLFVVTLTPAQYEIIAYRTKAETIAKEFVDWFYWVKREEEDSNSSNWNMRRKIADFDSDKGVFIDVGTPNRIPSQIQKKLLNGDINNTYTSINNLKRSNGGVSFIEADVRRDHSAPGSLTQRTRTRPYNRSSSESSPHRLSASQRAERAANTKVEIVANFNGQAHLERGLPLNVKESGTCLVKSYCNVDNIYMRKGSTYKDVCCQTMTLLSGQEAGTFSSEFRVRGGRSKGSDSQADRNSKPGSVRSSLASESFRRQVNELTQEVRQLRQVISHPLNKDIENISSEINYNNRITAANIYTMNNVKDAESFQQFTEDPDNSYRNKTPSRVVWSPTLEQVEFNYNIEDDVRPLETSTPRELSKNGVNGEASQQKSKSSTMKKSGLKPSPPEAQDNTEYIYSVKDENGLVVNGYQSDGYHDYGNAIGQKQKSFYQTSFPPAAVFQQHQAPEDVPIVQVDSNIAHGVQNGYEISTVRQNSPTRGRQVLNSNSSPQQWRNMNQNTIPGLNNVSDVYQSRVVSSGSRSVRSGLNISLRTNDPKVKNQRIVYSNRDSSPGVVPKLNLQDHNNNHNQNQFQIDASSIPTHPLITNVKSNTAKDYQNYVYETYTGQPQQPNSELYHDPIDGVFNQNTAPVFVKPDHFQHNTVVDSGSTRKSRHSSPATISTPRSGNLTQRRSSILRFFQSKTSKKAKATSLSDSETTGGGQYSVKISLKQQEVPGRSNSGTRIITTQEKNEETPNKRSQSADGRTRKRADSGHSDANGGKTDPSCPHKSVIYIDSVSKPPTGDESVCSSGCQSGHQGRRRRGSHDKGLDSLNSRGSYGSYNSYWDSGEGSYTSFGFL